jgi:hypothetical protein
MSHPKRQVKRAKQEKAAKKPLKEYQRAVKTNWFDPMIWRHIAATVEHRTVWSPQEILDDLRCRDQQLFKTLTRQVIGTWMARDANGKRQNRWSDQTLANIEKNLSRQPGGTVTRCGILAPYPDLCDAINKRLRRLRESGVPVSRVTVRSVMVSLIEVRHPEIFRKQAKDGSYFRCSDCYVRKYIWTNLCWSLRAATRAAQKLPENYQDILEEAYLREAWLVHKYSIPAALRVNTDQTQCVYHQGSKYTYDAIGSKQVPVIGKEEKRACTVVPSISDNGDLLPFQAIFLGQTEASCPNKKAPSYAEAKKLGFLLEPSKTSTYWSTQATMETLVNRIIAPYFERKKIELKIDDPENQKSIWKIDCWSVHKSDEFLTWMKNTHPNIIVLFVPGNCTGVFQPLNVGIQRVLKQSFQRSCHRDLVANMTNQLEVNPDANLFFDNTIGTLRDRALGWLVDAFHAINSPALIRKV